MPDGSNSAPLDFDRGARGMDSRFTATTTTTRHDARQAAHEQLQVVTGSLICEFAAHLSPGTVIGHVARAREQLLGAGVRSGLAAAAESMARARLRQLLPLHAAS